MDASSAAFFRYSNVELFHPQLYLNCIVLVLISFSHGYSATLAAKLIIKLDLTSALVGSLSPDILDTWPNHVRRLLLITSTTVSGRFTLFSDFFICYPV